MKKWAVVMACALVSLPGILCAQDKVSLRVDEMVFCTGVQERAPSGVDTAFASIVENVYCFVKLSGAPDTTSITHVWYFGDKEMGRVELAVKSASWRTWSSKKITADRKGKWRVDVLSPAGDVLKSGEFVIKP